MAHLIEAIYQSTVVGAIEVLKASHALIVERVIASPSEVDKDSKFWGVELKRLNVALPIGEFLIGKDSEKFVEIINILATTERTISALEWFSIKYPDAFLGECHASTSDNAEGSDIILIDPVTNDVLVRCEVTDIASDKPGQNGKEKKDLKNLGCGETVPSDGVTRYIATSQEFAGALTSKKRAWSSKHYRYIRHETTHCNQTALLEITSAYNRRAEIS